MLPCAVLPEHLAPLPQVPPSRSDVLHACDVMEDVAIAYGFNNIAKRIPPTVTQGRELPLNQLSDLLRLDVAMAGARLQPRWDPWEASPVLPPCVLGLSCSC